MALQPMNLNQVTLPAIDVGQSVAFYKALGLRLIVDAIPRYARFECVEGNATISLDHVDTVPPDSGVVVYFECEDLDSRVEALQSLGLDFDQPPRDEKWLWREARLRDPSNNTICLYWAGANRRYPPWRVSA